MFTLLPLSRKQARNGCQSWDTVLGQKTEAPLSALLLPPTRKQARGPADCAKAWSLVPPSLPLRKQAREQPLVKALFSVLLPLLRKQARGMVVDAGAPYMVKNRDTVVRAATATANTQPSKGAGGRLCQGYVTRAAIAAIAQASKRMAVNQGTAVCSAAAAIVVQASKGIGYRCWGTVLGLGRWYH